MKASFRRATSVVVLTVIVAACGVAAVDLVQGGAGAAEAATTTSNSSMAGMSMGSNSSSSSGVPVVKGLKPVSPMPGMPMVMAITPIGTATWQGMKIQVRAMAPATFVLFENGKQRLVKPTKQDSFHVMVILSDAKSDTPIPYSSVWVTVTKTGATKPVYDERLWPMISQSMGVHYGNDVAIPAAGRYQMALLISPPAVARHMEYDNRWLAQHKVSFVFDYKPGA